MEDLRKLINDEQNFGILKGIKIVDNCIITHLLFMDGILIFLNGYINDTSILNLALKIFCKATGMLCNNLKYTLPAHGYS